MDLRFLQGVPQSVKILTPQAVQDPSSRRIWLVGGYRDFSGRWEPTDHIKELTFMAPPPKVLALQGDLSPRGPRLC